MKQAAINVTSGLAFVVPFLALCLLQSGCSGGGSESGGGGGGSSTLVRSSDTGVRILHGGLDFEPVDLRIADEYITKAAFMQPNFFGKLRKGPQTITLERAHSPGVIVGQIQRDFQRGMEYSVVLAGQVGRGTFNSTIIEEPIVRPEPGQARVQLVNLLENSSQLSMSGTGVALGPVLFRLASGYAVLSPGPQSFSITNSLGGVVAVPTVDIPNQGEATIVVGGDANQSVVIAQVYLDLD